MKNFLLLVLTGGLNRENERYLFFEDQILIPVTLKKPANISFVFFLYST